MYYSDFRQESGSEILEEILKANGYEKFDHTKGTVEEMGESDKEKDIHLLLDRGPQKEKLMKDPLIISKI